VLFTQKAFLKNEPKGTFRPKAIFWLVGLSNFVAKPQALLDGLKTTFSKPTKVPADFSAV